MKEDKIRDVSSGPRGQDEPGLEEKTDRRDGREGSRSQGRPGVRREGIQRRPNASGIRSDFEDKKKTVWTRRKGGRWSGFCVRPITLAAGRAPWRRRLLGRLDALTSSSTWTGESHFRTGSAGQGGAPSSTHPAWTLSPSRPLAAFSEMLSKWVRKQDTGLLLLGQTKTEKLLNPGFEALGQTLKDEKKKKKILSK